MPPPPQQQQMMKRMSPKKDPKPDPDDDDSNDDDSSFLGVCVALAPKPEVSALGASDWPEAGETAPAMGDATGAAETS